MASLTRENSRPNEKVILPTWQMQGSVPRRLLDSSSTEDGTRGISGCLEDLQGAASPLER